MRSWERWKHLVTLLVAASLMIAPFGCTGGIPGAGGPQNPVPGDGDDGTGGDPDGDDGGDGLAGLVIDDYLPELPLNIETPEVSLSVPPGASTVSFTVTLEDATTAELPAPPGARRLAGGKFEPAGQELQASARVTSVLEESTIATALPVLEWTGDEWIGTGEVARVAQGGTEATFSMAEFGTVGVPDGVSLPPDGSAIGDLLTVANVGAFTSSEIDTTTGMVLFSDTDFLDAFDVSMSEPADGVAPGVALSLSSNSVTRVGNFVVGEVGGFSSAFSDGSFAGASEPVVGVMIMSLVESTVHISVYVATPSRLIVGNFTGETF